MPQTGRQQTTTKKPPRRTARTATKKVSPEQRWKMVAEAAYYKAEKRGFQGGDSARDWLEAEAEIDAQLAPRKRKTARK